MSFDMKYKRLSSQNTGGSLLRFLFPLFMFSVSITGKVHSTNYFHPNIDYLNVYQGAGYENQIIGQLRQTDLVSVCSTSGGWSNIVVSSKPIKGYVVAKFMTKSDYSPGYLNKQGLFSSGKSEIYRNGIEQYQSNLNRYSWSIITGCLIVSVFMGISLFIISHKIRWSGGEWIFTRLEKLPLENTNISVIHWFVIIGVMEGLFSIFTTLIIFPIATVSFGIEFSVIVSFLLWVSCMVIIPVRIPVLLKRLGYQG